MTQVKLTYVSVAHPMEYLTPAHHERTNLLMGGKAFDNVKEAPQDRMTHGPNLVAEFSAERPDPANGSRPCDILAMVFPPALWNHQLLVYIVTHPELTIEQFDEETLYEATMDVFNAWMLNQRGDIKLDVLMYQKLSYTIRNAYMLLQHVIYSQGNYLRAFHYNDRLSTLVIEHTSETDNVFPTP